MNATAKKFTEYLKEKEVKHSVISEDDENSVVKVGIMGDNCRVEVLLIFPNSGDYAWLRCFQFANVPENKLDAVLRACNQLNQHYRWVKFYIDEEDHEVTLENDALIHEDTCGEHCFEILCRMTSIADEAYPVLMKAIYA